MNCIITPITCKPLLESKVNQLFLVLFGLVGLSIINRRTAIYSQHRTHNSFKISKETPENAF